MNEEAMICCLVDLALGNPKRTPEHQEALLQACATLDNPLVNWTHDAETSWLLDLCPDCDRTLPHGDVCPCSDENQMFSVMEA